MQCKGVTLRKVMVKTFFCFIIIVTKDNTTKSTLFGIRSLMANKNQKHLVMVYKIYKEEQRKTYTKNGKIFHNIYRLLFHFTCCSFFLSMIQSFALGTDTTTRSTLSRTSRSKLLCRWGKKFSSLFLCISNKAIKYC